MGECDKPRVLKNLPLNAYFQALCGRRPWLMVDHLSGLRSAKRVRSLPRRISMAWVLILRLRSGLRVKCSRGCNRPGRGAQSQGGADAPSRSDLVAERLWSALGRALFGTLVIQVPRFVRCGSRLATPCFVRNSARHNTQYDELSSRLGAFMSYRMAERDLE